MSAPAAGGHCVGSFPTDAELRAAPAGKRVTIEELHALKPSSGRFTVEGWVQLAHHCGPCPPGASCKPCDENVILSTPRGAYKGPTSEDVDLKVAVPDASQFELLHRYRVTVDACERGAPAQPLRVELRGYEPIAP